MAIGSEILVMNINHFENARCLNHRDSMVPTSPKTNTFAKSVCTFCPHKSDCLDLAIRFEAKGIWGETDEEERKEIIRKRSSHATI